MQREELTKRNGGVSSRIGVKFHLEVEDIKDKRLRSGESKDRTSTEKITNAILRHNSWKDIKEDIIQLKEEELSRFNKK